MKFLVVLSVLGAGVASSFDMKDVRPRHFDTRLPLVPIGRSPLDDRITNSHTATAKQFPYQVGLLLGYPEGKYWCGGTLISASWIVTAAHCTLGVQTIQVTLGGVKSSPNGDIGELVQEFIATSDNVIVHKGYDDWTLENNISLIRLPNTVKFTDYIKPAKLPRFTGTAPVYTEEIGVASGWGLVSDTSIGISPNLQWADVDIIPNAACSAYHGRLPTSVLCISTKGTQKSICNGDSGGPLVLEGTDTLIGITSFGVTYGCEVNWPVGFSRVTYFLDWIKQNSGLTP